MKKRFLSILMALILSLSMLPATAIAASVTDCDGSEGCTHEAAITVNETTTHYDTLTEALSAATEGQTVTLLKDIDNSVTADDYTSGVNYALKAGIVLDGNGHTISGHIGVNIPTEGATVQDVKFMNIHNNVAVDDETCEYYGWESKTGNQSAIYAASLTGTATITGCTFDNIDWDAIQITPTATASIVIKNNVFQHTNTTDTQLRYIHIQYTGTRGTAITELTVTDNQFYNTENPNELICSIGIWKVNKNTSTLQLNGNYVEDYATVEVDILTTDQLFPARSTPDAAADDLQPVAYNDYGGTEVYVTLQEAADKSSYYIKMMADAADQTATIPAGQTLHLYSYGYDIGTLTNNGELNIWGTDIPATGAKIINNGKLSLKGNAATVYEVENNGTLEITAGKTYDLSKITGNGSITISGGTFYTKPDDTLVAQWYIAKAQSDGTYKVSKMSASEAVDAGMVAASGTSGSSLTFYRSVTEGMNVTDKQNTVLHTDVNEQVTISTPMEKYTGIRVLNANGHVFTGSITVNDGCGSVRLYGKGNEDEITLTDVQGELLYVGGNTTAGHATLQDAQLNTLDIAGRGSCTVEGGQYQNVITEIYYKSGEPQYTAALSITGGSFASDTVTVKHSNGDPDEIVPLSTYVAEGYVIVESDDPAYPYTVAEAVTGAVDTAVAPAAPIVEPPTDLEEADQQAAEELVSALEQSTDLVAGDGLDAAALTQANSNTTGASSEINGQTVLEQLNKVLDTDVEASAVNMVVQPYMEVAITDVDMTEKALTLDVAPKYNLVATTVDVNSGGTINLPEDEGTTNAVIVKGAQPLTITKPVTVTIPLPTGFVETEDTDNIYVKHSKDGAFVAYHKGTVSENALTFTNDKGFSTFQVTVDPRSAVVKFGEGSEDTTLTPSDVGQSLPDAAAPSGQAFEGWQFEGIDGTYTTLTEELLDALAAAYGANPTAIAATPCFYTPSTGGGSVTRYEVGVPADVENGTVKVSPTRASRGSTVTITVTPDEGYELDALTVTDADGKTVAVTDKGDGKFTFTMPRGKVSISASFKPAEEEPSGLPFTDVAKGAWYYGAVEYAYENGLMTGTSATLFAPGVTTSRAMLATLLYRLEGEPVVNYLMAFDDVAEGLWYSEAIRWASAEGVVNGIGDGSSFDPAGTITREQMAVMLYRYAQYKDYDVTQGGMAAREYADYESISSWAVPAVEWAVNAGLISGTSATTLSPQGSATRAEIATILMRFVEIFVSAE